jgi:protein-S-isoprenylcysteine O-methyltransferase Ste14
VAFFLLAQLIAMVILVVGLRQTGVLNFLGFNVFWGEPKNESQTLNTGGLYRYVRHPLYSAGMILLWASPTMTTNYFLVSICLSVYILIGAYFEERKLIIEYGDSYLEYMKKVPMLIPRLLWNK